MVQAIREVECALGNTVKLPTQKELATKLVARKSLIAAESIRQGDTFTEKNIILQRPGTGISPLYYWDYLERVAQHDYHAGELIHE